MPIRLSTPVLLRMSVVRCQLAVSAVAMCCACAAQAGPSGLLNDTGQTQCDNGSNTMVACTADNTGDAATYKRQDGRFGRDPAAPAKVGGGLAGFDFTRICFNGDVEGAGTCTGTLVANTTATATGTPMTDWACTKDNVTNLIWSLQTKGTAKWGVANAASFTDDHNNATRCGFASGWRVPTRRELLGIVLNDGSNPTVDSSYFPSTQSNWYWSSELYAPVPSYGWIVDFGYGGTVSTLTSDFKYVRLVRSGP